MNQYFVLWYYTKGLAGAVSLFGTLLHFVLHRFHIGGLVMTLFSPWKRDVTFKNWLGFHPFKSLQTFFENLVSRFLGMIVRLLVVLVGLTVLVLCTGAGVVGVILYAVAPVLVVVGLGALLVNPILGGGLFILGASGMLMGWLGYLSVEPDDTETADIVLLGAQPWFRKLLGRLGLEKKELSSEALKDTAVFLDMLRARGIDQTVFEQAVRLERQAARERARARLIFSWENLHKQRPLGKGWRYAYTPHLDRYALDLSRHDPTEYAHATLVGRQEEFKVATLVLERPSQNNVLLVGDPGIGKEILIHHLARLVRENTFEGTPLGDTRFLILDVGQVVSDALTSGADAASTVRMLLGEAAYAGNIVLVIENIDTVLDEKAHGLAPVLGEFLALPGFRLMATMPSARYRALAQGNEQLFRFFETIFFRETTEEETLLVLLDTIKRWEKKRVIFTLPGLLSIITQSSRYKWEVPFPERALDLAEEVLSYWQSEGTGPFITPETVEAFVSLQTGMPTGVIGSVEKDKLLRLEEYLHERVVGQDEAVTQVAEAMRRARAGFGNAKRPLGSFLFLGPTGVGKTETVKALAECYFGSEDHMIRLDMSEYQTGEAVARLIGSEALGETGRLTDLVKEKPFSILLLDELEKVYPKALDLFLQILDEGFVTDSAGEKVSFRNTIIIATSNAGAPLIKAGIENETPYAAIRQQVLDHVVAEGIYRLEFLNRFDGVIFFEPLAQDELRQITEMKLRSFAERLKKEKNITITFAPGVADRIIERGYEPEFGARSINRYIEDAIEDRVVKELLSGTIASGGTLSISADDL